MKPDWDKLGQHYADHPSVMIVDVDCTADGQGTCNRMGVQGYPTIKYFMSGDKKGKDYQMGRDFNSLKQFAESKLNKPVCDAATKKGCAKNEIAFIEKHEVGSRRPSRSSAFARRSAPANEQKKVSCVYELNETRSRESCVRPLREGKTLDEIKAVMAEKAEELKAVKAEKKEAEAEMKAKQKEWKKKEGALNKATNILKQMEKAAK